MVPLHLKPKDFVSLKKGAYKFIVSNGADGIEYKEIRYIKRPKVKKKNIKENCILQIVDIIAESYVKAIVVKDFQVD